MNCVQKASRECTIDDKFNEWSMNNFCLTKNYTKFHQNNLMMKNYSSFCVKKSKTVIFKLRIKIYNHLKFTART